MRCRVDVSLYDIQVTTKKIYNTWKKDDAKDERA